MNVQMIPVSQIKLADNVRFGLKKTRINSLADDIQINGLLNPITVELLPEPDGEVAYQVQTGNYRYSAVAQLVKDGTNPDGDEIAANVADALDDVSRIKIQLSENMEREDMSPMDKAVAIKQLVEVGLSKVEIRELFGTPGGRKGAKKQPASNSYINMMLSFLQFPKEIQKDIHEGLLTVGGAYKLTKTPEEKWAAILEDAKKEREKFAAALAADEEKLIAADAKLQESKEKAEALKKELEESKAKLSESCKALDAAAEEEAKLIIETRKGSKDEKEKEERAAKLKAAKEKAAEMVKASEEAKKAVEKTAEKLQKAEEKLKNQLDGTRKAPTKKENPKAVGAADIDKSAAKVGSPTGAVPFNANQMREAIKDWSLPGSFPKLQQIFTIVKECFSGEPGSPTPNQAYSKMAVITGEKEPTSKKKTASK